MNDQGHLIVHAGFVKTGSSALQYWFDSNVDALARAGVRYPRVGPPAAERPGRITSGNGELLSHYLCTRLRPCGFDPDAFESMFKERLAPRPRETVLISAEQIGSCEEEQLRCLRQQLVPRAQITFVVFVRDIYGLVRAAWIQAVKRAAWTGSFERQIDTVSLAFVNSIKRMMSVLGRENVRVLHYDSVAADIVGAFLNAIGLSGTFRAEERKTPLINRSLSDAETRVLIACNAFHQDREIARLLSDHLMHTYPDRLAAHTPDPAHVETLRGRFESRIRWVNDNCFGGREVYGVGGRAGIAGADVSDEEVWKEIAMMLVARLTSDARSRKINLA